MVMNARRLIFSALTTNLLLLMLCFTRTVSFHLNPVFKSRKCENTIAPLIRTGCLRLANHAALLVFVYWRQFSNFPSTRMSDWFIIFIIFHSSCHLSLSSPLHVFVYDCPGRPYDSFTERDVASGHVLRHI